LTGFSDKTLATKEALGEMVTAARKCTPRTSEMEETRCCPPSTLFRHR
jgi:hypothetical protein